MPDPFIITLPGDPYYPCPICGQIHDDGAFILTQSGNTYFICFDCDEKYTGDKARKILEKMEREEEKNVKIFE